ncbi:FkbM family methyltransferase [Fulvivirga maritima]|uniref:FkbM family methyltransferase n=1 Tax=Fulvivirga maritima TaxID=2904247 RepID=UPI001F01F5E5|nr:FkbM family methyltransferase [Fulvivirga maritima]UII25810.1 FkbM family methyltransferase [Fulvivirga maritima]
MLNKLKKTLELITGYWIYQKRHLPVGTDLEVDLQRINLLKSMIVFDVGANIGQTATYFNKLFPRATIYSFEPVKKSYEELKDNTQNLPRVKANNIGFGERNESIEITLNPNPTCTANSLKPELMNTNSNGVKETLDIKKIDTFCEENGLKNIDFLKIDTEGWEIQTLMGAANTIAKHNIKAIICEVGFTNENNRNTPFQRVNEYMSNNGFYFYGLYDISHIQLKKGSHYGNALFINTRYLKEL